jgi:hypothetical protein
MAGPLVAGDWRYLGHYYRTVSDEQGVNVGPYYWFQIVAYAPEAALYLCGIAYSHDPEVMFLIHP